MWANGYDLTNSKLAQTTKGIILSGGLNTQYIALSTDTGTFNLSANSNGFFVGGNSTIQGNLSVLGDLVSRHYRICYICSFSCESWNWTSNLC